MSLQLFENVDRDSESLLQVGENLNSITYHIKTSNLSSLTLHCNRHPLQAANCCRNSRLVVDEDDLMLLKKIKKIAMNW